MLFLNVEYFLHGLLEAFPISSSMHMLLLGFKIQNIGLLHGVTALVTAIFFHKKIMNLILEFFKRDNLNTAHLMFIILFPKIIIGFLIRNMNLNCMLGISSIIFGFLFFIIDKYNNGNQKMDLLNFKQATLVSTFSLFSFLPGASSLGTYYTAFRFFSICKKDSLDYAFILNIIPSLGAFVIKFNYVQLNFSSIIMCMFTYVCTLIFCRKLTKHLYFFGIYRVLIGIFICISV